MLQKPALKIDPIFPAPVSGVRDIPIWDQIRLVPETGAE